MFAFWDSLVEGLVDLELQEDEELFILTIWYRWIAQNLTTRLLWWTPSTLLWSHSLLLQSHSTLLWSHSILHYCDPIIHYCDPILHYCDPILHYDEPLLLLWSISFSTIAIPLLWCLLHTSPSRFLGESNVSRNSANAWSLVHSPLFTLAC